MIALAQPPLRGEAFPPEVRARKKLYAELQAVMRQSEMLIARQFRAFARAIVHKADYLVALSLDEYADNVDNVLGGDLNDLTRALQVALQSMDKRVLTLGAQHAMGDPALASIDIAWDLQRPDVERYLASHAAELVQGINDTTRTRLATVLRQGVRDGKSIPQITQDVMTAARSMSVERARLIAQTETLRGYNAGAVSAMRASDVVSGMRFVDGQFGACPFCQSLNGKIVKLDEGFEYAVGDRTVSAPYPPVHPGCRCTVAAVILGVDERPTVGQRTPTPITPPTGQTPFARRVQARVGQGIDTEADVSAVGKMVRQEIEERRQALSLVGMESRAAMAEQRDKIADELDVLFQSYTKGDKTPAALSIIEKKMAALQERHYRLQDQIYVGQRSTSGEILNPKLAREVLKELREFGGVRHQSWASGSEPEVMRLVDEQAADYIPRSWLERSAHGNPMQAIYDPEERGYHRASGGRNPEEMARHPAQIALPKDQTRGQVSVAIHEMMHRSESLSPTIVRLEREFWERRTAGEVSQALGPGYNPGEIARRDKFSDAYIGKDYGGRAYEVLSMGSESVMYGTRPAVWDDDDYIHFILGMFAVVP